ncbi:MAG: AAA family ATPase [Elusimicrobia bacterium]|nr:AAA family ATPase [Elusimicrobiota bacterium]
METNFELNKEFKNALKFLTLTTENVFVTGKAGTGKTTFLKYFVSEYCKPLKKNFVVLAPTGVAAVNAGGETIHHFFKFKPDVTLDKIKEINDIKSDKKSSIYKNLDLIIIDEVSMLRADLLDCVEKFLRLNGPEPNAPFGGVQMLFVGDLMQLAPVVKKEEEEIFKTHYDTPYFLSAKCMQDTFCYIVELEKVYRQKKAKFIAILNAIRDNKLSEPDLSRINNGCDRKFDKSQFPITLTTTNRLADFYNNKYLNMIHGVEYTFTAVTENIENVNLSSFPAEYELKLKVGARIMMLNNDSNKRWVNGTLGTVEEINLFPGTKDQYLIYVRLQNGKIEVVDQFRWDISRYKWNSKKQTIETEKIGSFAQYPLRLAWAITIHKSQGKTFNNIIIDLGYDGAFAPGQLYVALSRCTEIEGIALKSSVSMSDIIVDPRVAELYAQRKKLNELLRRKMQR